MATPVPAIFTTLKSTGKIKENKEGEEKAAAAMGTGQLPFKVRYQKMLFLFAIISFTKMYPRGYTK